jgi:predicted dehydrogenase/threonine dehydrogenase-like Zn-dependent dehydrogenase
MKQIIQYQKSGEMFIEDLPVPIVKDGWVLVQNVFSLLSTGSEKTSVETAQASMLGKAKSRPDLVKQVLDNVKREGLMATYDKVKTRLDNYKELGYSCAGVVLESGTDEFKPGDRVACGGATANHSEVVLVPKNLVVKIPDNIGFDEAAFTTLGSIAMQGVRQADLRVGECAVVLGLGLLGLITVQILKASGCKVAGLDISDTNFDIAKKFGCDLCCISNPESVKQIESFTNGFGTDAVIITAGTKSNEPVELAIKFSRKKGKVVVVGAVGMNLPRAGFYEKEIDFRISCSYGPGRYDINYEENGQDYPFGFVRWTENRNMQSVLELISAKKLDVKSLISHKIQIEDSLKAYDIITGKVQEKHLGVLIEYPAKDLNLNKKFVIKNTTDKKQISGEIIAGFIGAGNFAQSYLIPNLKNIQLKGVVTDNSVNANSVAKKFGFEFASCNADDIINDKNINTIFVATRHDSHSDYVLKALKAGKNVYVEKPLAINYEQLKSISNVFLGSQQLTTNNQQPNLMVGYNRRFSESFKEIKKYFDDSLEPFVINYRVHAGFIPKTHWTQQPEQGGRIIGEGCHFIDMMQFITGAKPISVYAKCIDSKNVQTNNYDNVIITIKFSDGSVGSLSYLANGDSGVAKEYCEIYNGGKTALMKNFISVELYKNGKKHVKKFDGKKGHKEELKHFLEVLKGKAKAEISFEGMYLTTLTTFKIMDSLRSGKEEQIN